MSLEKASNLQRASWATPEPAKKRVRDYYTSTEIDYRRILKSDDHLGLHYGYFDRENRDFHSAILNMNRQLAFRSGMKRDFKVLDAGCGIGGSSIWLAENYGVHATGLTLSEEQCRTAGEKAKERKVDHLTEFFVGDYCNTGFSEQSFDVVWAIESVCYAARKSDFVREASRLLKPGGILIIADGFRTGRNSCEKKEKILSSWLEGWAVSDLDSDREMVEHLRSEHFVSIEFEDITRQVLPFSRHLYSLGILWSPITHFLKISGLLCNLRFENSKSTVRQYHALKLDAWKYGILTGRKPEVR